MTSDDVRERVMKDIGNICSIYPTVAEPFWAEPRLRLAGRIASWVPAWHDRPTGPGLWVCLPDGKSVRQIVTLELDEKDIKRGAPFNTPRVYGPIPKEA